VATASGSGPAWSRLVRDGAGLSSGTLRVMSVTTNPPGLRERKKAATRQALHEAAVRLAVAHALPRGRPGG
jgi:hypothetical protein